MSNWLSGLRRVGSLLLIGCAALIASSAGAYAQGFAITKVSTNSASFPAMAVDANGNLNVVWIDSVKGLQFARSTSSANGTALGTPVDVPGPGNTVAHPAFQPQIAVYMTQANVIEVVWAAVDPTSPPTAPLYDVFAAALSNQGRREPLSPRRLADRWRCSIRLGWLLISRGRRTSFGGNTMS